MGTVNPLEEISLELGLSVCEAEHIILQHHALKHLYPKKDLKKLTCNINLEILDRLNQIAKALKVDVDAVINHALLAGLAKERYKEEG